MSGLAEIADLEGRRIVKMRLFSVVVQFGLRAGRLSGRSLRLRSGQALRYA